MNPTDKTKAAARRAIKLCGGVKGVAEKTGASPQLISYWNTGARAPSTRYALALEHATGGKVTLDQLRPDVRRDWGR